MLLNNAELQSVSEIAVLNGANAALVGNEIIQFKSATLLGAGEYRLSGLLRGRLGTEWAIAGHVAGERFILLDGAVDKQVVSNNMIGLSRPYKPVTIGSSLSSAIAQSLIYTGIGLKPYSPVHVSGTRDGSSNLTINWVRRTRIAGDWRDSVDVPLNEISEAYEIDIMNGGSVVRTLNSSTATVAYSSANQVTDFGSPQASLAVRVYQLSDVVGRGYMAAATI